ncbi:hypothetical protein ABI59_18190 [Acidobacteria bacterium Mor1]|nr:hypothetical protein ABI59_18190 [Acidobacteria bacterium Mor1]
MIQRLGFILVIAALLAPAAFGQERRNATERAGDHRQLRYDRVHARDDVRDHGRLTALVQRFDEAREANNREMLRAIDNELARLLNAELSEGRREVNQARREVRQSEREVRSSRREVRANRRDGAAGHVRRDDRRDLRDDRRDLHDDRRDVEQEAYLINARLDAAHTFRGLQGKYDEVSLEQRRAVMTELVRLAEIENRRNKLEAREDRRELREDRRETREDRRQGG